MSIGFSHSPPGRFKIETCAPPGRAANAKRNGAGEKSWAAGIGRKRTNNASLD